jgi:hypothetical protein
MSQSKQRAIYSFIDERIGFWQSLDEDPNHRFEREETGGGESLHSLIRIYRDWSAGARFRLAPTKPDGIGHTLPRMSDTKSHPVYQVKCQLLAFAAISNAIGSVRNGLREIESVSIWPGVRSLLPYVFRPWDAGWLGLRKGVQDRMLIHISPTASKRMLESSGRASKPVSQERLERQGISY